MEHIPSVFLIRTNGKSIENGLEVSRGKFLQFSLLKLGSEGSRGFPQVQNLENHRTTCKKTVSFLIVLIFPQCCQTLTMFLFVVFPMILKGWAWWMPPGLWRNPEP